MYYSTKKILMNCAILFSILAVSYFTPITAEQPKASSDTTIADRGHRGDRGWRGGHGGHWHGNRGWNRNWDGGHHHRSYRYYNYGYPYYYYNYYNSYPYYYNYGYPSSYYYYSDPYYYYYPSSGLYFNFGL